MNTGMLENPITQDNLATLERYGFTVIPSESGVLACKDVAADACPRRRYCWSTSCTPSPARRIWPGCASR